MIHNPIHVGLINGHPIRFFKPPKPELGPQFPWHCHDDLAACLDLPPAIREHFRRVTAGLGGPLVQSVATGAGILLIASHSAAQGLIGAAIESHPQTPREVELQYVRAAVDADNASGSPLTLDEMIAVVRKG